VETIYYNFPPYELIENHDVPDYENFKADIMDCLPRFNEILPALNVVGHSYENDFIDEIDNMADHARVINQILEFDARDAELFDEE